MTGSHFFKPLREFQDQNKLAGIPVASESIVFLRVSYLTEASTDIQGC